MITGYCTYREHYNCTNDTCTCQCHSQVRLISNIREGDHVLMFNLKNSRNPWKFGTVGKVAALGVGGALIRLPITGHPGFTVDYRFAYSFFTLLGRTR